MGNLLNPSPKEARIGDDVLVHAGFAIQKLDWEVAHETLSLSRERAGRLDQEESMSDGILLPMIIPQSSSSDPKSTSE